MNTKCEDIHITLTIIKYFYISNYISIYRTGLWQTMPMLVIKAVDNYRIFLCFGSSLCIASSITTKYYQATFLSTVSTHNTQQTLVLCKVSWQNWWTQRDDGIMEIALYTGHPESIHSISLFANFVITALL